MRLPDIVYVLPLLFVGLGAVSLMIISTFKKVSTRVGVYYTLFFLVLAFVANLVSINSFDEAYSFYPFVDVFKRMMVVDTYSDYFSIFLILGGI